MRNFVKTIFLIFLLISSQAFGAAITSKATGDWSAGSTWDSDPAIPASGDTVTIANTHTVTLDQDLITGAVDLAGLTIDNGGTLICDIATGTYSILCSADINCNGTFQAGTSTSVPLPSDVTFTIDFDGTSSTIIIHDTTGSVLFYCQEPTYKYVMLDEQEPAVETVFAYDDTSIDLTTDIWAVDDTVAVCDLIPMGTTTRDNEEESLAAVGASTVTLNAGITNQKEIGTAVILITRNIRVIDSTDYAFKRSAGGTTGTNEIYCEVYNCSGGAYYGINNATIGGSILMPTGATATPVDYTTSSTYDIVMAMSDSSNSKAFDHCYAGTINSDSIVCGFQYGYNTPTGWEINGETFSCQLAISSPVATAINGDIYGSYYGVYSGRGCFVYGDIYNTRLPIASGENVVVANCELGKSIGGVTSDYSLYQVYQAKFYNVKFSGTTEYQDYDSTTYRGKTSYSESLDHERTENAYKAWCLGGVVTSQTASPPTGYSIWYKLTAEDTTATYPVFRQYETVVQPGTAIEVEGYLAIPNGEDMSGCTTPPTLQIIDKFADNLVDSSASPLDEDEIPDNSGSTTTWQAVSVIWSNSGDSPRNVIVRMITDHDGGGDDVEISSAWSIAGYQDQIATLYNVLMPVKTDVATSDTTTSFTLTGGTATADIYNNMTVMVQDADDDHWELRSVSDWTAGKVITVDTAFGFTPTVDDLVYIMATSYGAPVDTSSIADAVWDEAMSDHTTETTFGGELQTLDPNITLIKYKTDLLTILDTTVSDSNDANNFEITAGVAVDDAYWFNLVIVEDADDSHSEIRWIDIYEYSTVNDFTGDANCVALYSFESGALTTDSIGTNTLTSSGSPVADTSDYKEFDSSVDLESGDDDRYYVTNGNLDAGFPGTAADPNLSVCGWFKLESAPGAGAPDYNHRAICGMLTSGDYSWGISACNASGNLYLRFRLGYNGGASVEETDHTGRILTTGVWYHFGVTYQDSDKSYQMRLYDYGNTTAYSQTGNTTNNMNIGSAQFDVGVFEASSVAEMDGNIDGLVIFNDILSISEIDQIRGATFGSGAEYDIYVDEPFSFTPAVSDVVHIMGTSYGGYLDEIYDLIRQSRSTINVIDATGARTSSRSTRTKIIYQDDPIDVFPGL